MKVKSIEKMMRANRKPLSSEKLHKGLKRFQAFVSSDVSHTVACENSQCKRHLTRLQIWSNGKHGMICRIGDTVEESKAKVGLAIPIERYNLTE